MSDVDNAVTPGSTSAQPQQNQANGTTGTFGTNNPGTTTTPMPSVTPIQYPYQFNSNQQLGQGGGNSSSSSSGGNPAGYIGAAESAVGAASSAGGGAGIIGLLGALFADGGLVGDGKNGFAQGGPTGQTSSDPHVKAAGVKGYLIGALHQQKYGGTADTLGKAAQEVKQMLMDKLGPQPGQSQNTAQGQPGFASGGEAASNQPTNTDDAQLVTQAIQQSLGINPNQNTQNTATTVPSQQTPQTIATNAQTAPQQVNPSNPNGDQAQNNPSVLNQVIPPVQQAKGGFMQHLDAGGPPIPQPQGAGAQMPGGSPQGPPPLQPGQVFQGDGSVKGPGTGQSDSIPAKLSNGEFVMSQPAVQFFGVDKLVKMNEQGKQGYMQAIGQVQQNQQQQGQPQGAPPMAAPQAQPQQQPQMPPPTAAAKGGMMQKRTGFMGM
jgi:hypothetical protein